MADMTEVFTDMQQCFDADSALGIEAELQFQIDQDSSWVVSIKDGQCNIVEAQAEEPDVTLKLDSATLVEVLSGETEGMEAFMEGQIEIEGDVILATRLAEIFPVS